MALHWDVTKIKDFDAWGWYESWYDSPMDGIKVGDKLMNPVTDRLIWTTMIIGIGTFTKANIKEVFYRVRSYEAGTGALIQFPVKTPRDPTHRGQIRKDSLDAKGFLTPAEVVRHVGLATNVGAETATWWKGKLDKTMRREADYAFTHNQGE